MKSNNIRKRYWGIILISSRLLVQSEIEREIVEYYEIAQLN